MLNDKRQQILAKTKDIEVKTKALVGYPSEKIIEYAAEESVGLIIIGNVGLSGASRIRALGSVSRNVSERASCPVIIVH